MDQYFWERDFTKTVRDYDFTRRASREIRHLVNSKDFESMTAKMIFDYLYGHMEMVSFKDYLKRYLYIKKQLDTPFKDVPDAAYREIIMDEFAEHQAPRSFTPTSVKWSTTVNRWLEQEMVQRPTVFLLGFGLGMSADEVGGFLTKVLKESDFNQDDPWEMVCRYCFSNNLPYTRAAELMDAYERMPMGGGAQPALMPEEDCGEAELLDWLRYLKALGVKEKREGVRFKCFMTLYRRCQAVVAEINQIDEFAADSDREWQAGDIRPSDIESMLYDGVPTTKSGNLEKMSKSLLNRQFQQKRITRQRMDSLLKGELEVDRYDLITLQFLSSSQLSDEDPRQRCRDYIDEMNSMLRRCGMMELYQANPYEAFVMMCLLSEDPVPTFCDVWQQSYAEA